MQLQWLKTKGIDAIVCLSKERPLNEEEVKSLEFEYAFIPVKDGTAPRLEDIKKFVSFTNEMLAQNKAVVVCCEAGIGRTGTILAAYLVSLSSSPKQALQRVEEKRGVGVESHVQREAVFEYASHIGKCQKQSM